MPQDLFQKKPFQRPFLRVLQAAMSARAPVFHALIGPRQVGKTTMAKQLAESTGWPCVYASADLPLPPGPEWIETQWALARLRLKEAGSILLILDELQKVHGWTETLKRLWDEEKGHSSGAFKLLVLGSSAMLVQQGLGESLAGRFYLHRCPHWSFPECRDAFGWTLDQWIFFGGYPGAASFLPDEEMWRHYVADSLLEATLARDVFQMQRIAKPALMRQLFLLSLSYPSHILSYTKMLGQLHDAGNTTTLAHYLRLLESACLVSGLEPYSPQKIRQRGGIPKLVAWNNAPVNAISGLPFQEARRDAAWWGWLVENAVGGHMLASLAPPTGQLHYWRDGKHEVDYVAVRGRQVLALEVKSGRSGKKSGIEAFRAKFPAAKALMVGGGGIPLEEFFSRPAGDWFG